MSEANKIVTDPAGCGHDYLFNFNCGDYKCSACGEDVEVRCDGDEGRCPICGPKCNMEIYSPKPRRFCGEPGKWKHARYPDGVFCDDHKLLLEKFLPDGWKAHGAVAPASQKYNDGGKLPP